MAKRKSTKGQTTISKTYKCTYKTKDRVSRTPLKTKISSLFQISSKILNIVTKNCYSKIQNRINTQTKTKFRQKLKTDVSSSTQESSQLNQYLGLEKKNGCQLMKTMLNTYLIFWSHDKIFWNISTIISNSWASHVLASSTGTCSRSFFFFGLYIVIVTDTGKIK